MLRRYSLAQYFALGWLAHLLVISCPAEENRPMDPHSRLWRLATSYDKKGMVKEAIETYQALLDCPPLEKKVKGMSGTVYVASLGEAPGPNWENLDLSYHSVELEIVELVRDIPPLNTKERESVIVSDLASTGAPQQPAWRRYVLRRLDVLLENSGDVDAWVQNHLRAMEGPWGLVNYRLLESGTEFLEVRGHRDVLIKWAGDQVKCSGPAMSRAYLLLRLGRTDDAIDLLEKHWDATEIVRPMGRQLVADIEYWSNLFDRMSGEAGLQFVRTHLKLAPEVPSIALYWVQLRKLPDDASLILHLESVLKTDSKAVFCSGGKIATPSLKVGNPMELADRLRRLYLATGRPDAASALTERVRKQMPPFDISKYPSEKERALLETALRGW